MGDAKGIFESYVNWLAKDALKFSKDNGLVGGPNAINGFVHTYVSADITYRYGEGIAEVNGDVKEFVGNLSGGDINEQKDSWRDQYNNELGRQIAISCGDDSACINQKLIKAYIQGRIIKDPKNDPRVDLTKEPDKVSLTDWNAAPISSGGTYLGTGVTSSSSIGGSSGTSTAHYNGPTPYGWWWFDRSSQGSCWQFTIKISASRYEIRLICTPIGLDLDGDGLELIPPSNSNVVLDYDGAEFYAGWLGADDGLLYYDSNNNNIADNELEYFHTSRWQNSYTDLGALLNDDTNNDKKLSSADTNFSKFKIWRDLNQDGISASNETFSLGFYNISWVNLQGSGNGTAELVNGNTIFQTSTFGRSNGTTGTVGDIGFGSDVNSSINVDDSNSNGKIYQNDQGTMLQWLSASSLNFDAASNTFNGKSGFDTVMGFEGADNLSNSSTNTKMLIGGQGNDTLTSTNANDLLYGGSGNDTIHGGGGNDKIYGDAGTDNLYGGAGDDTYYVMKGGIRDIISDASGSDRIVFDASFSKNNVSFIKIYGSLHMSGSGTNIEIIGWPYATNKIEYWDFSDGTLTSSYIDANAQVLYPVILDLDGDGVELLKPNKSNVKFDVDGDGKLDELGWVKSDDAFLVIDRNNNGIVDDLFEISFIFDKPGARTDLEGLQGFDTNGDLVLNRDDKAYNSFLLWRDVNQDGLSSPDELLSIEQSGVTSGREHECSLFRQHHANARF